MTVVSDVYVGLQLAALSWPCQRGPGLALYGVEQRKWSPLLRGWPAALQPSKVNVNKLYIYGLAQE